MMGTLLICISKMATPGRLKFSNDLYRPISFIIACVSFSELENDTLNQAELNEIKINENNEIFEVPGLNENPRRRTLFWP